MRVCLSYYTLGYPQGGGHMWVFLNWALGLRALGCDVWLLEIVVPSDDMARMRANLDLLRARLAPFGLADSIAVMRQSGEPLPAEQWSGCPGLEAVADADLLLDFRYDLSPELVRRFRRSAQMDIDPGLLQTWLTHKQINIAPHDLYFTIGETVGTPAAKFPSAGLPWQYTPPCVALDAWPVCPALADAPFTTVAHWYSGAWLVEADGTTYENTKGAAWKPYLDVARRVKTPLELATDACSDPAEEKKLRDHGWRVRDSRQTATTAEDYRRYVQQSRGEFTCVKPSCVHLQNAWVSDRSLCYLASGKPVIIEHTGPSRLLPDAAGMFRFRTPDEAVRCVETVAADYDRQCQLARALAEEHFDARKVAARLLERALA